MKNLRAADAIARQRTRKTSAAELRAIGRDVLNCWGDGNCLFRAWAVLQYVTEEKHLELRQKSCTFMQSKAIEYAPFFVDGESFEEHLASMREEAGRILREVTMKSALWRCAFERR